MSRRPQQVAVALVVIVAAQLVRPFEVTEYVGLGLVWAAFAITAPFSQRPDNRQRRRRDVTQPRDG